MTIVLYVNSVCNAHCKMCDVANGKKGIARMAKGGNLTMKLLDNILDQLEERITIYLGMTEPLMHPKIGKIIEKIKDKGHFLTLTTNGYLLPEKARELGRLDGIQVSIDGPKEIHDSIRGEGFYENAVEGIKYCTVPVYVNYTVTNLNYHCIEEFITSGDVNPVLFKVQFMDFVSKKMQEKQNKTWLKQDVSCISEVNPDQVDCEVLREQLNRISRISNVKVIPETDELEKYFNSEGEPIAGFDSCTLPYSQMAINTNGDIMFHMRCFNYVIGNVKDGIYKSFNGKKANKFRDTFKKHNNLLPACTRCCGAMQ